MAITKTALDAKLELAISAIGAGSYGPARTYLVQAQAILIGMPNYRIGSREIEYEDKIDRLIQNIDTLESKNTAGRKYRRVFAKATRE